MNFGRNCGDKLRKALTLLDIIDWRFGDAVLLVLNLRLWIVRQAKFIFRQMCRMSHGRVGKAVTSDWIFGQIVIYLSSVELEKKSRSKVFIIICGKQMN